MPWHDENPWRRRHKTTPQTPEQRMDEIEQLCRAGDISLRQAIEAAYRVGALTINEARAAKEE